MGWGRMLLLGNVGQQMDISDLNRYIQQATAELNQNKKLDQRQAAEIAELQAENRELKLYTLGLVRLLRAKGLVTDDEIQQLVQAVDAPKT